MSDQPTPDDVTLTANTILTAPVSFDGYSLHREIICQVWDCSCGVVGMDGEAAREHIRVLHGWDLAPVGLPVEDGE